jgi:hypothetical protein
MGETHVFFFFFNGWVSASIGLGVCAIRRKYGRGRGCARGKMKRGRSSRPRGGEDNSGCVLSRGEEGKKEEGRRKKEKGREWRA